MSEKEIISPRQFLMIVILYTIGSAILIVPSTLALYAKQDAWIAAIVGGVAGFFVIWLFIALGSLFPSMTLFEINEKLLGKWPGKLLSLLLFALIFIGGPVPVLYDVGNFMTSQMLPETPIQAIIITFALIVVFGVRLGLETIARASEILLIWFFFLFFLCVFFVIPQMKIEHMQPVLEAGLRPIYPAALYFLSISILPIIVLMAIFPAHVNRLTEAKKAFMLGNIIGVAVLLIIIALSIIVLGPDLTSRNLYPSYALTKKINVGQFIQRVEAIMAFMWFISLYLKLSIYFYATAVCIAKVFNLNHYRPLLLPLGGIMIILALVQFPNSIHEKSMDIGFWVPFMIIAGFIYPLLLLGLARIRKRRMQ